MSTALGSDGDESVMMETDENANNTLPTPNPVPRGALLSESPDSPAASSPLASTLESVEEKEETSDDDEDLDDDKEDEMKLMGRIQQQPVERSMTLPPSGLLFFPLERIYGPNEMRFSALRGRDRLVAGIFQQNYSVYCDLATVDCCVVPNDCCGSDLDEDCDCPIQLTLKLKHVVGVHDNIPIRVLDEDHSGRILSLFIHPADEF